MVAGRVLRFLVVSALSLSLASCFLAPGQYVGFSDAHDDKVKIVRVTPQLLDQQLPVVESPEQLPPELTSYNPGAYLIGPGDMLYVTVWEHPELTTPSGTQLNNVNANGREVEADGTFFYPYIGAVQAGGKTLEDVRADITDRLAKYIQSPQVSVSVLQYASQKVFYSGAFLNTTTQTITTVPLSLAEAVNRNGINQALAYTAGFELIRDGVRYRLDLDQIPKSIQGSIMLKAGDTLYLPYNNRNNVYVMGEVLHPIAVPFRTNGISLADALAAGGGMNPNSANGRKIYVIRDAERAGAGYATTVYQLNADSAVDLSISNRFMMQPGDVLYVGIAQIARWNRFLSNLLPLSNLLNQASNIQSQGGI